MSEEQNTAPYQVLACGDHFHVAVGGYKFADPFPTREAAQAVADRRNNEAILDLPSVSHPGGHQESDGK